MQRGVSCSIPDRDSYLCVCCHAFRCKYPHAKCVIQQMSTATLLLKTLEIMDDMVWKIDKLDWQEVGRQVRLRRGI